MYEYTIIDNNEDVAHLIDTWKNNGLLSIAMDFEGEFNLHIYGEHLCLIQLFDTQNYYLIDPFQVSKESLALLFEDPEIEKIMFACASDASLVRKEYGLQLKNVWDVRVPAMMLGFNGNYLSLVERNLKIVAEESGNKKKNQMTNWLTRPLKSTQIQYALNDVAYLHALKESLLEECKNEGLLTELKGKMKNVAKEKNKPKPGWMKICNWKKLNKEEKVYLKYFFIARDTLAKAWNVPAARILNKRTLVIMCKDVPESESQMKEAIRTSPKTTEHLLPLMMSAKTQAHTVIRDTIDNTF